MRYQVGQEIIIVHFAANDSAYGRNNFYRAPFLYNSNEEITAITFKTLTVTEHHLVAWDQDPTEELKYNGYLLKDAAGQEFSNQYPRASYGQTSTTGDLRFNVHCRTKEDEEKLLAIYKEGTTDVVEYHLFTDAYQDIVKGIADLTAAVKDHEKKGEQPTAVLSVLLQKLSDLKTRIDAQFAKDFPNMQLTMVPYSWSTTGRCKCVIEAIPQ